MVPLNGCNHQAVAAAMEVEWRRLMVTIRRINHLRDSFMCGTPLGTFTSTQQLLPAVSHHSGPTHIDRVRCGGSHREGSLRLLMHSGLQHLDLRDSVSLLLDLLHPRTFSPHRPSSVARLNYIIHKTVEDLWTPLTLRAVWLVGTPSVPVETYTHQRLSMQKIQETQRGGQRWFCAMKMVHKGPLRREINVSWLKGACCDGPEDVSQIWGGWMNVSGIPTG